MENENIIDVSEATFDYEVIERSLEIPVVVDFWAPWCGPCRMLSPILERLAADPDFYFILAKVNVDENPGLSMAFRVQGIPAVKGFVDGDVIAEFTGVQPEPNIRQFLHKLIPDETEMAISDAKSLLATQHWTEAESAFQDLYDEFPGRVEVSLGLARALLAQGSGCEALDFLQQVRDGKAHAQAEMLRPLAKFLCDTANVLDAFNEMEPLEAQYRQAGRLLMRDNFEAAMDGLIDVLRQDKRYRKGEPQKVLLGLFELLGDNNTLTQQYRNEMALALF
ncbi:MAG: tetratricopeptide repeat protein [Chloroflexi bacterium]|nr:tetratricopeptide repeat protein [Chloroflexota bacterium]